ncbi:unnamed protein product [Heterobilharzia americana]|nr:unnamed protein product [Heterobilharzia americana]
MENGEDEEEDLSEGSLDQSQLQTVQLRGKPVNQRPGSRAPTMTIDVVRVGRPLKILACLLSLLSLLLFIIGSVSTSWIYIQFKSIGLFQQCDVVIKQTDSEAPSSINTVQRLSDVERTCQYRDFLNIEIIACIILDLVALLLTLLGCSFLLGGIFAMNIRRKQIFYQTSVILNIIACVAMLLGLILLVVTSIEEGGEKVSPDSPAIITVGWSLIVVCCGIVILGIAVCLVLFDKGGEEIEYRETIHRSSNCEEDA